METKENENVALKLNIRQFECPICFNNIRMGHGFNMSCCQNYICYRCIHNHIRLLISEVELVEDISCPFCPKHFSFHSIFSILRRVDREKLLDKQLEYWQVTHKTFNCINPNCPVYVEVPEKVKETTFKCPNCAMYSCISCGKSHDNNTMCAQLTDPNYKISTEHVQSAIRSGEYMICDGCNGLVTKISGCHVVYCRCKNRLCWISKKSRYGPNGCKCKTKELNYAPCHPNCHGC
ncbi:hypothetical protein SNEBB_005305 [Seison nebaliae]|nr:hypothetical protein SNEBB_005305 [Seison nebaliae]